MEPENTVAAEAPAAAPRRGRPRIVKEPKVIMETAPEAVSEAPVERPALRADLRAPMREEDPRERAARRAAEIRGNLGNMDEGTDDFRAPEPPDGWTYEWKTKTVLGQENPAYQVEMARKGWEPVPASRHPSYMPDKGDYTTIERKGMILMERPKELVDEARDIERRKARNQVRQKEAQLNSSPDGQFGRDNKGNSLVKVGKSYEAIPIPKD
jgi:hypothetical protein